MWQYNYTPNPEDIMHYGVLGMKWGVRKSVYKSMNKQQRKEQRKKYRNTPEGKIKKATTIGTAFGGPLVGVIAGSIAKNSLNKNSKISSVDKKTIEKGKNVVENLKKNETDEQKIARLVKEGKIDLSKRDYLFDQNGNLFYVGFKD